MATMSDKLREESHRLSYQSIEFGSAYSGIAANVADEAADLMDEMAKVMEEMQQEWHHMIGFSSPKRFHDLNGKAEAILTRFREAG